MACVQSVQDLIMILTQHATDNAFMTDCCQVRLEFVDMLADWMLTLRERIDHHARLMPYALSALSDSSKDVQMSALKLMDDVGVQYEEEHQQDLKVPHSLLC